MKSILFRALLSLTLWSEPSQAQMLDASALKGRLEKAWVEVKENVDKTVVKVTAWWNELNGQPTPEQLALKPAQPLPPKPEVAPPPQVAASGVAQPNGPQAPEQAVNAPAEPILPPASNGDATLEDVKRVRSDLKNKSPFQVSEKGSAADPKLKLNKSGIPYMSQAELKAVQEIPALNIGREDRVSKADFTLPGLKWTGLTPKDVKPLETPELMNRAHLAKIMGEKIQMVGGERKLQVQFKTLGKAITLEEIKKFSYPINSAKEIALKPYEPLSPEEIKMVAALILFDKGTHCHMVMGLMNELKDNVKTKFEALYHLGACATQLKMTEASFSALSEILKSPKNEYSADALSLLAKNLPKDLEQPFYTIVKEIPEFEKLISEKDQGDVYYRMAKGAFKSKHFNRTHQHAAKVPPSSTYGPDARFLASVGFFNAGKKDQAFESLLALEQELTQKGSTDSNLKALVNTNLARMKFLKGDAEGSLPLYLKVPKDHGLWVQALIEQGWAQLSQDDFSGAIGNMYSLHSPYFQIVYQPESFVVRTIGYLNICQYGDAYKTLSKLEEDYRDYNNKVSAYMTPARQPAQVYESVRGYLKGKSTSDVDGLPHQILREAARGKAFLNLQSSINEKADEVVRYEGVNKKIKDEKANIRSSERMAKKRFDDWRKKIGEAQKKRELAKNMDEYQRGLKFEKDLVIGYRFQLAILEQSRQGYLKFQEKSQAEVSQTKSVLAKNAGEWLFERMKGIKTEMSRVLENNEFLRYEVFSGSGENIRYQVAGGETSGENRVPASIKPQKSLNWSFDGEFWEDEIGNYRSSLRNNCPQISNQKEVKDDQAMLSQGAAQ